MADVFISYARTDEKIARRVASAMQKAGFTLWWDADLSAHRSYSEEIETQLREAKAVVVLWSKEAAASQWVRAEADVARNAGKLVQLGIDGTVPPIPFNQIQCADLSGWRGSDRHSGLRKALDSVAALSSKNGVTPPREIAADRWWDGRVFRWSAVVAALLLFAAIFLLPRFWGSGEKRPVVAVLPFESLDKSNASLVAGIWEDTRQAISRNPQLLVLGPNTAAEISEKGSKSASKLADYLVEASVRSAGDRVRISANLVRTDNGTQLWSKTFDRRLDDVFALQSEIAGEIEGHIRGRLAERGGVQPENIATTGEVYALYSDARAKIRKRDSLRYEEARDQLRQVVKLDPNFAPGWATLSIAEQLYGPSLRKQEVGFDPRMGEIYARRAIALAPNLAAGHSALGYSLRRGPAAEAALKRAIALDSNEFESINWLANLYKGNHQGEQALKLYSRAVEIEPLFWPATLNKLDLLMAVGDQAAIEREQERIAAIGDPTLTAMSGIEIARARGDLSEAAKLGLALLRTNPEQIRGVVGFPLFGVLLQLGFEEEARKMFPPPPFGPLLWKNDPRGLDVVESLELRPEQFFALHPLPMNAGRVYILSGRGKTLAELYRKVASNPKEMVAVTGSEVSFAALAPFIAMALQQAGDENEAARVLYTAERILTDRIVDRRSEQQALLARVHATQGKTEQALSELSRAVGNGWLPAPPEMTKDILLDPAFASLTTDPRFNQLREKILRHLAKERKELGRVVPGSGLAAARA